jgi:hypothetical protein
MSENIDRMIDPEDRSTHPHAANQPAGSKHDNKLRTDVTGNASSAIGEPFEAFGHFAPMAHHAPIHGMSTRHDVIECPSCSAGILWNGAPVAFICRGCGATVDGASLSGQ